MYSPASDLVSDKTVIDQHQGYHNQGDHKDRPYEKCTKR